jgi:NADH-quinone oxidoreductase subunit C
MTLSLDNLSKTLNEILGDKIKALDSALGELTLTVSASDYYGVCQTLSSEPSLAFEQLIDLCAVDYSTYKDGAQSSFSDLPRFAVVSHLLSIVHNFRLRVRVFAESSDLPRVSTVSTIWSAANWYEREAFDLYGVIFEGHEDLRRILTDYGFIGHPFRKDFPLSGHVEMRYDAEQKRVIYQPVTIEPREITPRIIREDNYGGLH